MDSQDKDRVAYYAAIAIFFSTLELFIPKVLPFFRLGIANIPILLSLNLPFSSFMVLVVLKGIGNSYISGNLFSIFALVSIAQSIASGVVMFGAKKVLKGQISNYGLSLLGALVSTYVQIYLASLYIGKAITKLLPIMLTMSLISALFVAFVSYKLEISHVPTLLWKEKKPSSAVVVIALAVSALSAMMIKTPLFALGAFISALILQRIAGRKIKLLPHFFIMLAMIVSSLLTPKGKVLFSIGTFDITKLALTTGLTKALALSTTIAISQAYSQVLVPGQGLIGKTLAYFTALFASFKKNESKNILSKARETLALSTLEESSKDKKKINNITLLLFAVLFLLFAVLSRICP